MSIAQTDVWRHRDADVWPGPRRLWYWLHKDFEKLGGSLDVGLIELMLGRRSLPGLPRLDCLEDRRSGLLDFGERYGQSRLSPP
jgi:hypothetical protein